MHDMPRPRPPHLIREKNRHGDLVWYVRVGKGPRTRIKAAYGTAEFAEAYRAALAGEAPKIAPATSTGSLRWLVDQYRKSSEWKVLSPATRRQRDNILSALASPVSTDDIRRQALENQFREDAFAATRMIREAVEFLGPIGALPSEDAQLGLTGPSILDDATTIVEGITNMVAGRNDIRRQALEDAVKALDSVRASVPYTSLFGIDRSIEILRSLAATPPAEDARDVEIERLRGALTNISLCSQNCMSSKDECGRIARAALRASSDKEPKI